MSMESSFIDDRNASPFSEAEVEFLAEDETISIVPNFRSDVKFLATGPIGPFRPSMPVAVPLWLAIALKKRSKCTIQPPAWLTAASLSAVLEAEREQEGFQEVPFHYIEISQLLFAAEKYGNDIQDLYKVRSLVQDLRDVRFSKMQSGLKKLQAATNAVKLANLSAMELHIVRPFFSAALSQFSKREAALPPAAAAEVEAQAEANVAAS